PAVFVARAAATYPKPLTSAQVTTAAKTGACNALNDGGCTGKLRSQIGNQINQGNNNLFNKINAGFGATNTALNQQQLGLLNTLNTKMGAQLPGGLSGTFGRLWQTLQVDRALNLLTYVTTLHNAMMLSNQIGTTLFGAVDNLFQSAGFKWKDEKGSEVGLSTVVSQWTTNFFKGLFGVENFNAMALTYKKANRVYQSGANIISSVRSMTDSVKNVVETGAENTGRIGNALKKWGVVGENAYKSMPENVNAQTAWIQRLEKFENAASSIEMVTSEVLSVTQDATEIKKQLAEFNKGIEELQPKTQIENKPVAKAQAFATRISTPPNVKESDLNPG
ncbi:hypothetical protein, partial [Crocosphaera sp.]|uniref:hypothetical protein n=1 Tax=Crocosphaera sp. TaxID=2729996 RepID=UPI00257A93F7